MIIIQSESFENFFSDLIGNSPLSSIEFFEDLEDDYSFQRTWDIPDQWIWIFESHQDLKDLINDFNLSEEDLMIFPSMIMDVLSEIIESDYSQDFMNQMGIIKYIPIRKIQEGIEEIQFFFKDKESLENYLKEYNISKDGLILN